MSRRDYRKSLKHLSSVLLQERSDEESLPVGVQAGEPEEDDTSWSPLLAEDQLSEIFISRDEKSSGSACLLQNKGVVDPGLELSDVEDLMTLLAEQVDDLAIDPLIRHQPHAASPGIG
jgi:hypothetical protein